MNIQIHETAIIDNGAQIGKGSRVWHWAHVCAGAKIGKASRKGGWEATYRYQDLEADAVVGLLSDSNFAGGGTDGKGHSLAGAYGINNQWKVALTWFINNEAGEKNLADLGGALNYDRIIFDTAFKF